jgi:hypothetical protein
MKRLEERRGRLISFCSVNIHDMIRPRVRVTAAASCPEEWASLLLLRYSGPVSRHRAGRSKRGSSIHSSETSAQVPHFSRKTLAQRNCVTTQRFPENN